MGRAALLAAMMLAIVACEQAQPEDSGRPPLATEQVYESDRVEVFIEPGAPFCQGDGVAMDTHVEELSAELGIDPPEQITVAVVGDDRGEAIAQWCFGSSDSLGGCFQHWSIMAKIWAIPHELNHAVFTTLNPDVQWASSFWMEAYASAWETHSTDFFPHMPGLAEQSQYVVYDGADHLIRWLQETHGTSALADFYASLERDMEREDVDAVFTQVFGASYEEILAQYEAGAAWLYPGFGWCEGAEVIDLPLGETHLHLTFDCDAADTYAFADPPIEAMYVRRILRLPERSELHIEYSSPARVLRVHPCFDEPVHDYHDPRLSWSAWTDYGGGGVPPMASSSTREKVEAGDNEFAFAVPLGGPVELDLVIQATPTPK